MLSDKNLNYMKQHILEDDVINERFIQAISELQFAEIRKSLLKEMIISFVIILTVVVAVLSVLGMDSSIVALTIFIGIVVFLQLNN